MSNSSDPLARGVAKFRKAVVAAGVTAVAALVATLTDGVVSDVEVVEIVSATILAGLAVYRVKNAKA